ncbi:hypothetical protein HOLleu_29774 [Holothuria leucospilota]|uniref:Uncharacterized protein n=1 Tax=Holothuria leucospilota TaxID=206669 RepID=A0A9Q1GZM0_HOLLE|nr:hypothetical protein HOLleu_29774 [Holothuria leucospilota]
MSELPAAPWTEVSIDFSGPFPSGDYLLVITDDYSRYPIVEITKSTSAKASFLILDNIFHLFESHKWSKQITDHLSKDMSFVNLLSTLVFDTGK